MTTMVTAAFLLVAIVVLSGGASTSRTAAARRHHHHYTDDYEAVFERQEADRVEALPGQPSEVGFRHFSGYVTVNQTHGRALFYWFLEATHNVQKKPVVLWLNGGPGCSSLGTGAIQELGPFLIQNPGTNRHELRLNPESWNREANLLFLESPAGVGFSYTNTTSDLQEFGDELTAHDAYTFLVEWFKRFPQFKRHDFYITGESYAGHYVPQLAEKILEMNRKVHKRRHIYLRGFMIGNAAIDDASDDRGMVEYAWDHAVISDELHSAIATYCDFSRNDAASDFSSDAAASQQSDACDQAMDAFYEAFDDIDIYSLYTPVCTNSSSSSSFSRRGGGAAAMAKNKRRRRRRRYLYGDYDPCLDQYASSYLNRGDVQRALHANVTGSIPYSWAPCSDALFQQWQDSPASTLPAIRRLADAGLRVWVYSGDTDARVPVTSTRYALRKLGLATVEPWREWFTSDQVGGYTVAYHSLTFVTVRGAGHMVPTVKPVQARQLLAHFLAGKDLPRTPPAILTEDDS